ncbi:Serine/threonine-protein kinase 25, partial [Rhizophlyctis rosea]
MQQFILLTPKPHYASDDLTKVTNYNPILAAKHVAEGLDFLQAKGKLHRDIKLANIMVKDGRFKIGDLGVVRNIFETADERKSFTVISTGHYYQPPPELRNEDYKKDMTDKQYELTEVYNLGQMGLQLQDKFEKLPPWNAASKAKFEEFTGLME